VEQGRALGLTVNAIAGQDWPAMPYPVALGAAARGLDLPVERVISFYLHAFATGLVQAGVRFVPLGQTEGQGVLAGLHGPLIGAVAAEAALAGLDDLGSGAFRGDMAAMRTRRWRQGYFAHDQPQRPLRVGIGGPVGAGKTTLTEQLCRALATAVRWPSSPTTSTRARMPNT
jgi:hypothetical protein